jgi:hypothetical protein
MPQLLLNFERRASKKRNEREEGKGAETITPNELHLCTVPTHDSHPRLEFLVRYGTFPGIVSTSGQTQVRFAETVSSDPFLNVKHLPEEPYTSRKFEITLSRGDRLSKLPCVMCAIRLCSNNVLA